ncbi:uncharacterized protein LOC125718001 isoform X2 [Brienomyrus brachyistius]|nr:uncharacterized protein LOC125718001 isoform X2 [Brienomyrus brachyistius]
MTYNIACVISAGRAVLEMMQFDWEPLSHGELDQRLDQAVEEILEADLIERAKSQTVPVCLQQIQPPEATPHPLQSEAAEPSEESEQTLLSNPIEEDNRAVRYITDLLRNSDSSYSKSRLTGRARLSLPHTVLLSLTLLSRRLSYRSVSTRFRLEKGNIHRIFFAFCERVNALRDQQIRWPAGQEAERILVPLSDALEEAEGVEKTEVPKVFGILGHTRIPIRLPIGKQEIGEGLLEMRKMKKEVHPDSWLNLELVCDGQGRFLHCSISRGSDGARGQALRERLRLDPHAVPHGAFLVAGRGYPPSARILTPYPVAGCGPREEAYSRTLAAHLDVLDQAVAELKARFHRLRYLDMGNFERARAVVLTACILHNVLLEMGERVTPAQVVREEGDEEEGQGDEDGLRTREAIADLLSRRTRVGSS